jgi:hypothetical protein
MNGGQWEFVPPEIVVFRLAGTFDFTPQGVQKPRPAAFELSSSDKKDGETKSIGPLLSVWDHSQTSVSQAKFIRNEQGRLQTKAFALKSKDVYEQVFFYDGTNPLRVVRDHLISVKIPGADGHCGIAGLYKKPGEQKIWYKELRRQLVDLCWPLSD